MRSVVTRRFSSPNFCKSTCWLCSCRITHLCRNNLGTKEPKNNSPPLSPPNLPQVLGKQTLSQYLSPVSVYSVHRTTYFNSHLVRRSLLSTAMQCICQSPLQNLTVLHTHTHDSHGSFFSPLNVSIFTHMHFNVLWKSNTFFKRVFTSAFSEIELTTCNLIFETSLQNTCARTEVMKMRQTPVS